jgi:hypothetical protein
MKSKALLFSLFLICTLAASAQKKDDRKIIITLPDTSNLYQVARLVLINNEFIIKEDGRHDTVSTYQRELITRPGYVKFWAAIDGNTITMWGVYGAKKAR